MRGLVRVRSRCIRAVFIILHDGNFTTIMKQCAEAMCRCPFGPEGRTGGGEKQHSLLGPPDVWRAGDCCRRMMFFPKILRDSQHANASCTGTVSTCSCLSSDYINEETKKNKKKRKEYGRYGRFLLGRFDLTNSITTNTELESYPNIRTKFEGELVSVYTSMATLSKPSCFNTAKKPL